MAPIALEAEYQRVFTFEASPEHRKVEEGERFIIRMLARRVVACVMAGKLDASTMPVFNLEAANGAGARTLIDLAALQQSLGLDQSAEPDPEACNAAVQQIENEIQAALDEMSAAQLPN